MDRIAALAVTTAALAITGTAVAQNGGVQGRWRTDDGKAIITVAPCSAGSAALCGRISRFLVPEPAGGARDTNNPDRSLRSRPLLGVQVLSNLTRDGDSWTGRGYSPEEGRNFNATVTTQGSRLNLRGCVAIFCRTVVWTRGS